MGFNIHLTKAFVLVGIMVLIGILLFNKKIQDSRLQVFHEYSYVTLPPAFEIIQNTAGAGNYRTNVVLVFQFDQENFELFSGQNSLYPASQNIKERGPWLRSGGTLTRQSKPDAHTIIVESVDTRKRMLKFYLKQD